MNMFSRLALLLFVAMMGTVCHGETPEDSIFVEKLLASGHQETLWYARQYMGRPYVAHTLEVNDTEQLVVNTREVDCTTYVENVLALTLCARRGQAHYADFKRMLSFLRYRNGVMDAYPSRLHYFTDWINDNVKKGTVENIVMSEMPFSAIQTVKVGYMSAHPEAYRALREHPEFLAPIKEAEQRLTGGKYPYIPIAKIDNSKELRSVIHDGDVVAITTTKEGLDISHLGFAVWKKDGLHLLNASSIYKRVVLEPLVMRKYLAQRKTNTGIRLIRLR